MLTVLRPAHNLQALVELVSLVRRYRALVIHMTRREITAQYAGQIFGAVWAIGHPLVLMGVYIFVFAVVFKQKIGGTYELPLDYTTYLLSGLIPWLSIQQTMSRSCTSLTGNSNLVKQVVFPIEILPLTAVAASFVPQIVGLAVLVLYVLISYGTLPLSYLFLPLLLVLHFCAMTGIALAFAVVGAFFRDLKDLVQVFVVAGVFLIPAFYLPAWVPGLFRPILYLNPFSYLIWCYQDVLYFGRIEHPWAWMATGLGGLLSMLFGYRVFRRLKPHLGNVL